MSKCRSGLHEMEPDNRTSYGACRSCVAKRMSEYNKAYRLKHRDRLREAGRAHYQEHREAIKEKSRAWYQANSERAAAYSREYRRTHSEKLRARKHAYYEEHRNLILTKERERREIHGDEIRERDRERYAALDSAALRERRFKNRRREALERMRRRDIPDTDPLSALIETWWAEDYPEVANG